MVLWSYGHDLEVHHGRLISEFVVFIGSELSEL